MFIGYARISTDQQSLDLQVDALAAIGCEKVFSDVITGKDTKRPGLGNALSHLRQGDTLVVWRLDRLGRSLKDLINIIEDLSSQGINFKSLCEAIDTTTSTGKLMLGIFASLAEFERNLIRERTAAGLASARARGRYGGRKPTISNTKIKAVTVLVTAENCTTKDACKEVGISESSYYRLLAKQRGKNND